MKRWNIELSNGEVMLVVAESASITPSGALTFYRDNSLAVAYGPEVWDAVALDV